MSRTPSTSTGGTAAAAVLWAAAMRLAADVSRHSAVATGHPKMSSRDPAPSSRDPAARAPGAFASEWSALAGRWFGSESALGAPACEVAATFDFELGGGVLTHRALGGASPDAPCGELPRETLMTFFPRAGGREADAVRYDNAGQALCLDAVWSDDGRSLAMTSTTEATEAGEATEATEAGEPAWRWTWRFEDQDTLLTRLERGAPTGDARAGYTQVATGTLRRAAR